MSADPPIVLTAHAHQRFCERVESLPREAALARILAAERAIRAAADIGCHVVRMGNGARLILDGLTIVTVLGPASFGPHAARERQCRSNVGSAAA